jgi:hypothetical protein
VAERFKAPACARFLQHFFVSFPGFHWSHHDARTEMSSIERSIELRDLAVAIAKECGISHNGWFTWAETPKGGFLPKENGLLVQHWTPAMKTSQERPLPYGVIVSVREGETMKRMLDVEWADDGGVKVMDYEPGEWEVQLLML